MISQLSEQELEKLNVYIRLVRNYLLDYAELNYLQPGTEEFLNESISQAILMALEIFNACVGHLTKYNLVNFPVPTLLVIGSCAYTLFSGGILQARNHFSVSDGNTSGPVSEKTDLYRAWGQEMLNNFLSLSTKFKESKNMEAANGSFSSNYLLAHFYRDGSIKI